MIRRVGVVVAWFAITLVAIGIAATAVGSVRGQVTDVPAIPTLGTAALLVSSTTTSLPVPESSTTSTSTTEPPSTTTTSSADPTTTTTTSPITTTTTTTVETTSTTSPTSQPAVTTHRLVGGQVTISALDPTVDLVAAVPAGGFSAEIEASGPDEVRVEFESEGHKSSFRAEWDEGELEVEIDEEPDDD